MANNWLNERNDIWNESYIWSADMESSEAMILAVMSLILAIA